MRWVRAFAVTALAAVLLLGSPSAEAQETTTSTIESSTSSSLGSTTTLEPTDGDDEDGVSTGTWVLLITIGLVLAALLLAAFTWRYWRATKPGSASGAVPAEAEGEDTGVVVPPERSAPTV